MTYVFFSNRALQMQAQIPSIVTNVRTQPDGIHEMTVTINDNIDMLNFMHAAVMVGINYSFNLNIQKDESNY